MIQKIGVLLILLATPALAQDFVACAPGSYNPDWFIHEVRLLLVGDEQRVLDSLTTVEADRLEAVLKGVPTPGDARRMTLATLRIWRPGH